MNISIVKKLLPKFLIEKIRRPYHYSLAFLGSVIYCRPSRKIKVIAVTGTKGKTTVTELVNAVLETAGFKTALINTSRFKIAGETERNLFRMTMPGRFFLQKFLRRAVGSGCRYAVVEMTSEGARQFRHKFIELDGLIWTNLAPEHLESHGSYEKYVAAKLKIAEALARSRKPKKFLIINGDDRQAPRWAAVKNVKQFFYSLKDARELKLNETGADFQWAGRRIKTKLIGEFNIYNILAALTFAKADGLDLETARLAIERTEKISGRAERLQGPGFAVYVDYAHTPDSLEKFYRAFAGRTKICVLGNAGGGRDRWKRRVMGQIADRHCQQVILTDEDPYDEDPKKIIEEMAAAVSKDKLKIILDRREAIRQALDLAANLRVSDTLKLAAETVVLITGKGTDPFITGPGGKKIPWDDLTIAREELAKAGRDKSGLNVKISG